jgi:hypothetical protein
VAATSLGALGRVNRSSLAAWVVANPREADVLATIAGLSLENLRNALKAQFRTEGGSTGTKLAISRLS